MARQTITVGGKNVTYANAPNELFCWGVDEEGGGSTWFRKRAHAAHYARDITENKDAFVTLHQYVHVTLL